MVEVSFAAKVCHFVTGAALLLFIGLLIASVIGGVIAVVKYLKQR